MTLFSSPLELIGWVAVMTVIVATVFQIAATIFLSDETASPGRETIHRSGDSVTILDEDEHGYGTAVREGRGHIEIVKFDDQDEIYSATMVHAEEAADVADELSAYAVRTEERYA